MNIPEQVAPAYEYWQKFLETQITFWLKTSEKHTKEHCKRVLLYCLLIADQKKLPSEEWDILCIALSDFQRCRRTGSFSFRAGRL